MLDDVPEPLPDAVRRERGLVDARAGAASGSTGPTTWEEKGAAEKRLRFEEAFVTQTVLAQRRADLRALDAQPRGRPRRRAARRGSTSGCRSR